MLVLVHRNDNRGAAVNAAHSRKSRCCSRQSAVANATAAATAADGGLLESGVRGFDDFRW